MLSFLGAPCCYVLVKTIQQLPKKCVFSGSTFNGRINYLVSFTKSEKLLNMKTQLCYDSLNEIVHL